MEGSEGLRGTLDGGGSLEDCVAFFVGVVIREDTGFGTNLRVEGLGDTPVGAEEVEHVLEVEPDLDGVGRVLDLEVEVVLVAEVEPVDPRVV